MSIKSFLFSFVLACVFISTSFESNAKERVFKKKSDKYFLTYNELMGLSVKRRKRYLRAVARALIPLDKKNGQKQRKVSLLFLNLLINEAHASRSYRCVGGGVPIEGADRSVNCGATNYAGFSCSSGQEICNPIIFGVQSNGEPYCFSDATTELCFNRVRVRSDSFNHPTFQTEAFRADYERFRSSITEICEDRSVDMVSGDQYVRSACALIERQATYNRDRMNVGVETPNFFQAGSAVEEGETVRPEVRPLESDQELTDESSPASDLIDEEATDCSSPSLTQRIPRAQNRISGSQLVSRYQDANGNRRHCQVLGDLSNGHIAPHLTNLVPVQLGGGVTICVMPDYLSVGNDEDNVRMPLGRDQALEVAREMGFVLPTTTMVDAICSQARSREDAHAIITRPYSWDPSSERMGRIRGHDQRADEALPESYEPGDLVACHKKDLVMNAQRSRGGHSSQVNIYGWPRSAGGRNWQPLYDGHGDSYADYSHGIRLISQTAFINGQPVPITDLIRDGRINSGPGVGASEIANFLPDTPSSQHGASSCFDSTPLRSSRPLVRPSQETSIE